MLAPALLVALAASSLASITLPSSEDMIGAVGAWQSDNAVGPNLASTAGAVPATIAADHTVTGTDSVVDHTLGSTDKAMTSILWAHGSLTLSIYTSVFEKFGASTDGTVSKTQGANAALIISDGATLLMTDSNITTHNGAHNLYCSGGAVSASNSVLYSSGPLAFGIAAAKQCGIAVKDIMHASGGINSPSFAVLGGGSHITAENTVLHTAGIGSPLWYLTGNSSMNAAHNSGNSDLSPALIMDGAKSANIENSIFVTGGVAGMALYNSSPNVSSTARPLLTVALTRSIVAASDTTSPGVWCGRGTNVDLTISNSLLTAQSGRLIVADSATLNQAMAAFDAPPAAGDVAGCWATVTLQDSNLSGSLDAQAGSHIDFNCTKNSVWQGSVVGAPAGTPGSGPQVSVNLDATSYWVLTADSYVQGCANANLTLGNIVGAGHTLFYNVTNPANAYLAGQIFNLAGGGQAKPYQ